MNNINRKNIIIISAVFPPEPVVSAKLSFDIAEQLSVFHNVTVLSPKPTRPHGLKFDNITEENFNFKHICLESYTCSSSKLFGRFKESYSFGKYCKKYIQNSPQKIDLIYINTWPLCAQFITIKIAKKLNIPIITHIQDIYPESLLSKVPFFGKLLVQLILPIDKYIHQKSDKVLTISDSMNSYLSKTRKVNHIETVYNWQDENIFLNKRKVKHEKFTFLFLGTLSPTVGLDFIIRSFINANIPEAQFIIAGFGSEKNHLIEISKQSKLNNIIFMDAPSDKFVEIQLSADVLVLSLKKNSAKYALPSKLANYMFSSKPIIACVDEDSDTAKIVNDAKCGFVAQPENEGALINILKQISKMSDEERESMGKNGFDFAIMNFSKDKSLPRIIQIFNEVINNSK
jgi:glycosyltransferase involved in cell wall biosynthesis